MNDPLVDFVSARLAEAADTAGVIRTALLAKHEELGVRAESALKHGGATVHRAEAMVRLFEETVRPYLWMTGPVGQVAQRQLRILASGYAEHRDYRPEWRL
ncbi:DUF6221 family protein [Streptomyces sp. NPDC012888]|uniref:DUF6221 family protein n=1 Tax=Streptomyces sp. NPDC012888 TaxID=3364855 RepID=UPI0036B05481